VPYCDGGSKVFKGIKLRNVFYNEPLFYDSVRINVWKRFLNIIFDKNFLIFFKELLKNKAIFNKVRLLAWLDCTSKIIELSRNESLKRIVKDLKKEDYVLFFWGRETSEYLGAHRLDAKTIIRFHGYDLYDYRHKSMWIPYQENQIKNADLLLCISCDGKNYLSNKYPKYSSKFKLNKLGIINENAENIFCWKKDVTPQSLKIFTCSSLIPLKRVDLLLQALLLIKDIKISWIHIGDGIEKEDLLLSSMQLNSNIDFRITGWITKTEIFNLYKSVKPNLFLNLSTSEGLAVSIMEACSFGIPIIATNVGGTPELVDYNGVLIEKNITPSELAELIRAYAHNSEETVYNYSMASFNKFKLELDAYRTKGELIELILDI
jgi:glycosyltransferase involved in cell wall biosynthesis